MKNSRRVMQGGIAAMMLATMPSPAFALYYSWSDWGGFRFCVHRDGVTDCIWTRSIANIPDPVKKAAMAKASLKDGFDTREAITAKQQAQADEARWFPREAGKSQK